MTDKRDLFYFEWVVVDNCNFNCNYCVNSGVFSHKSRDEMLYVAGLEIAIANKILEFSRLTHRVMVNLTGGEPLLSDHFVEMLSILAKADNISVQLITNQKRLEAIADDILRVFPALSISGSLHVRFRTDREIDDLIAFLNAYKDRLHISLSQVNHDLTPDDMNKIERIKNLTGMEIAYYAFIPPYTGAGKVENAQKIRDATFVPALGKRCCLGYSHFFVSPDGTFYFDQWCNLRTRKKGDFLKVESSNFREFILEDMKKCPQTSCGCNYNVFNYPDYLAACRRLGYPEEEVFGPSHLRPRTVERGEENQPG